MRGDEVSLFPVGVLALDDLRDTETPDGLTDDELASIGLLVGKPHGIAQRWVQGNGDRLDENAAGGQGSIEVDLLLIVGEVDIDLGDALRLP